MTDETHQLAALEAEMSKLVGLRNERVECGQAMIDRANRDFDKAAIPLGRKINALREKLETPPPSPSTPKKCREPDSDWTPEDQAHYLELSRRESIR